MNVHLTRQERDILLLALYLFMDHIGPINVEGEEIILSEEAIKNQAQILFEKVEKIQDSRPELNNN